MKRDLMRRRACTCVGLVRLAGLFGLIGLSGSFLLYIDAERNEGFDCVLEQLAKDRSGELD